MPPCMVVGPNTVSAAEFRPWFTGHHVAAFLVTFCGPGFVAGIHLKSVLPCAFNAKPVRGRFRVAEPAGERERELDQVAEAARTAIGIRMRATSCQLPWRCTGPAASQGIVFSAISAHPGQSENLRGGVAGGMLPMHSGPGDAVLAAERWQRQPLDMLCFGRVGEEGAAASFA